MLSAAFLLASSAILPIAAIAADGPGAMLEDAIEAKTLDQQGLAARLFSRIVEEFPGTPEAVRAQAELNASGHAPVEHQSDREDAVGFGRGNGIDIARTERLRREFLNSVGDRVFFAENSASIGGRARAMIENQARWLKRHPDIQITIIGRADDGATREAAVPLSRQRAEAVRDRLIASGIPAERIRIDARGEADKLALCQSFMCKAQNRNVETLISELNVGPQGNLEGSRQYGGDAGDIGSARAAAAQSETGARIDGVGRP